MTNQNHAGWQSNSASKQEELVTMFVEILALAIIMYVLWIAFFER